ncbi:exodeoxyribonuclease VII small subunit [Olsenella sp. HMSC062G07]|uniref:exodeoxyribonuclease VII small subunit n=1 Tax=Olsenella sp. HMSC062G07 TaxID=1739330 RepID=UPI0008A5DCC7|nr:exodeoxyribonuclease VII small subunit [Olsenella sp. HMSC062G07]OFK24861.1 exodeoxyribonuclease VII [Olsenella sp. HMSC062G07]
MTRPDAAGYHDIETIQGRLDEIIAAVRDKDASLERSLDLFEEAVALGSKAVDLVDMTELSSREAATLAAGEAARPAEGRSGHVTDASEG